jgi:hypothetical protein
MNRIVFPPMPGEVLQGIGLNKGKGVARLRDTIDADDIETGAMVTDSRPACAREEIEKPGTRSHKHVPFSPGCGRRRLSAREVVPRQHAL